MQLQRGTAAMQAMCLQSGAVGNAGPVWCRGAVGNAVWYNSTGDRSATERCSGAVVQWASQCGTAAARWGTAVYRALQCGTAVQRAMRPQCGAAAVQAMRLQYNAVGNVVQWTLQLRFYAPSLQGQCRLCGYSAVQGAIWLQCGTAAMQAKRQWCGIECNAVQWVVRLHCIEGSSTLDQTD